MTNIKVWNLVERLNKSVKIGPYNFGVIKWTPEEAAKLPSPRDAHFDAVNEIIGIQYNLSSYTKAADAFLHEVFHGITYTCGLELGENEERVVTAIATEFVGVLQDNPWLIDWLKKAASKKK